MPSLVVAGDVGTLIAGRVTVVGVDVAGAIGCVIIGSTLRGGAWIRAGSTLGSGPCAAVTDYVILVVVWCTFAGALTVCVVLCSNTDAFLDTGLPEISTISCRSCNSFGIFLSATPFKAAAQVEMTLLTL